MSICRNICANGSPRRRRQKAISSSRSTSIRRAFCSSTKKPAVIGDGRLILRNATQRNATLTGSVGPEMARGNRALGDDLGGDAADAGTGEADGTCCTGRKVEHASPDERATVVDGDDHAAAAMGDAQLRAERQRAVGAGHGVLVEARTGSGLAAGFIA